MPIKATVKAVTTATGLKACNIEFIAKSETMVMLEAKMTIVPIAKLLWLNCPLPPSV
jgi:hypothetical protein